MTMLLHTCIAIAASSAVAESTPIPTVAPTTAGPTLAPTPPPVTDGYASMMLLGGTAFIMTIFCMASAHLKFIQSHTWSLLTAAVSIFVAVSWNTVVNYVVNTVLKIDNTADPPTFASIASSTIQILVYWTIALCVFFVFKSSVLRLKGYGTIAGHIMGFASIHLWNQVCHLSPFRNSAWWIVPVVFLIYLAVTAVILLTFRTAVHLIEKALNVKEEDCDRLHDQSLDTANDFSSLGAAFLVATWVKYLVFGQLDPAMADPVGPRESKQVWLLLIVGFLFGLVGAGLTAAAHAIKKSARCLDIFSTVFHTAASMLILDAFYWHFLPKAPTELLGKLMVAFILSELVAFGVTGMGVAAHACGNVPGALRGILTGLGLVLGSSWEKTFDASIDSLDQFGLGDAQKTLISFSLVAVVFPAWLVYILPKGDDDLKKEYKGKSPPIWAVCCDAKFCEDDEDELEQYARGDLDDVEDDLS